MPEVSACFTFIFSSVVLWEALICIVAKKRGRISIRDVSNYLSKIDNSSEGEINLLRWLGLINKFYRQIIISSLSWRENASICVSLWFVIDICGSKDRGGQCTAYLTLVSCFSGRFYLQMQLLLVAKANNSPFKFNIHNQEGARKSAHFLFPPVLINRRKERPFIDQANTVHRMGLNKISMGNYIKKLEEGKKWMREGKEGDIVDGRKELKKEGEEKGEWRKERGNG